MLCRDHSAKLCSNKVKRRTIPSSSPHSVDVEQQQDPRRDHRFRRRARARAASVGAEDRAHQQGETSQDARPAEQASASARPSPMDNSSPIPSGRRRRKVCARRSRGLTPDASESSARTRVQIFSQHLRRLMGRFEARRVSRTIGSVAGPASTKLVGAPVASYRSSRARQRCHREMTAATIATSERPVSVLPPLTERWYGGNVGGLRPLLRGLPGLRPRRHRGSDSPR